MSITLLPFRLTAGSMLGPTGDSCHLGKCCSSLSFWILTQRFVGNRPRLHYQCVANSSVWLNCIQTEWYKSRTQSLNHCWRIKYELSKFRDLNRNTNVTWICVCLHLTFSCISERQNVMDRGMYLIKFLIEYNVYLCLCATPNHIHTANNIYWCFP